MFNHDYKPAPFNPDFNPNAKEASRMASESMEQDGFYDKNDRADCAVEYKRRYNEILTALSC